MALDDVKYSYSRLMSACQILASYINGRRVLCRESGGDPERLQQTVDFILFGE